MNLAEQDRTELLDYGYLEVIEPYGSDERIIEAARMSTNKGFLGWGPYHTALCEESNYIHEPYVCVCSGGAPREGDEKLLRYLYQNKHSTPFEMAGLIIEVQAPLVVFREWQRHRTQSYNELSGRYTEMPDLYYLPSVERVMAGKQNAVNRQSSSQGFTTEEAEAVRTRLLTSYRAQRSEYEGMLQMGVAREISRLVIPVAQYSRMRAAANLRNWLAFLTLREDARAQWEIRQYAHVLASKVATYFPRTHQLYVQGTPEIIRPQ